MPADCKSPCRGVAQPGRALRSGRRGRRFKSSRPDHPRTRSARRAGCVFVGAGSLRRSVRNACGGRRAEHDDGRVKAMPHRGQGRTRGLPRRRCAPTRMAQAAWSAGVAPAFESPLRATIPQPADTSSVEPAGAQSSRESWSLELCVAAHAATSKHLRARIIDFLSGSQFWMLISSAGVTAPEDPKTRPWQ